MAMARNGKQQPDDVDKYAQVDACIQHLQDRHDYWYKITRSPATREAAMLGIVSELEECHLLLEELDMRCLTIFALCGVSIKKGTPREARLAYRAVGLLLLTLRDGSPSPLLDEAFPTLSKTMQAAHDGKGKGDAPPTLATAAIDCLAAASLAGSAEQAQRSMEAIWRVVVPPARSRSVAKLKKRAAPGTTSPAVLAAAVAAWTFLLTTVVSAATNTQRKAAGRTGWSAAVASLEELLDADDRRVRMAAGEALAVCVELNLTPQATGKDMDALVAKVSDLAAEPTSKGADNSLLREQRELFGQIAAFLDHDEPPPATSVRASRERGDVMKVSTWVRLAQLNFLSKFLGNGFLKHARGNPLLQEAFSFGRVEGKPLSIQKKESTMQTIDDIFPDREWLWVCQNIFCLDRDDLQYRCPEKLLQLGWH
jgi:hypothetical protein